MSTIITIDGERDETELEKRTGVIEYETDREEWVEYWDGPRMVHRSVHKVLKLPLGIEAVLGNL